MKQYKPDAIGDAVVCLGCLTCGRYGKKGMLSTTGLVKRKTVWRYKCALLQAFNAQSVSANEWKVDKENVFCQKYAPKRRISKGRKVDKSQGSLFDAN